MFIGVYNLPGVITLSGLGLGLISCFFALQHRLELALVCLMYAGIADLFDGLVARRMVLSEQEKSFGVQIDSLTDVVSFGVTPALIAFQNGLDTPWGRAILVAYLFAVVMRLAYFNITGTVESGGVKYYQGLPVTYAAMILPLAVAFCALLGKNEALAHSTGLPLMFSILLPLLTLFFLLRLPIPKPGGVFYVIFPLMALGMTWFYLR